MPSETNQPSLPHWDMTSIYPSLESPEFSNAFEKSIQDISNLGILFEKHQVRRRENSTVDSAFVAAFEEMTNQVNDLLERFYLLFSYVARRVHAERSGLL